MGKLVAQILSSAKFKVTVLNRSGTKPFDCCNVIKMNRNDISQDIIDNQDIVIDMCAYNVEQVKNLLKLFNNRHHYIVMSSIASEYRFFGKYGKDKAEIEKFLRFETDISGTILRPTYIIGKNDPHKRIDYFLDSIRNKKSLNVGGIGKQKISFVFKEDVAEVVCEVVRRGIINKTYNICNDERVSMNDLIGLFFKITSDETRCNFEQPNAIFEDQECIFSNELTKSDLGIEFLSLEDGIREYIISKS